jgi:hypothetical protein
MYLFGHNLGAQGRSGHGSGSDLCLASDSVLELDLVSNKHRVMQQSIAVDMVSATMVPAPAVFVLHYFAVTLATSAHFQVSILIANLNR